MLWAAAQQSHRDFPELVSPPPRNRAANLVQAAWLCSRPVGKEGNSCRSLPRTRETRPRGGAAPILHPFAAASCCRVRVFSFTTLPLFLQPRHFSLRPPSGHSFKIIQGSLLGLVIPLDTFFFSTSHAAASTLPYLTRAAASLLFYLPAETDALYTPLLRRGSRSPACIPRIPLSFRLLLSAWNNNTSSCRPSYHSTFSTPGGAGVSHGHQWDCLRHSRSGQTSVGGQSMV